MAGALCKKCGTILAPELRAAGDEYHVLCGPASLFADEFADPELPPGVASNQHAWELRRDLTDVILWAERGSERSQQRATGVSELSACYRRLGYRIAGVPATAPDTDPWPAIVGTGIHLWLEDGVTRYEREHRLGRWHTEMTVHPHPDVPGHTDLYDAETFTVIDYKSKGTEEMREIRKGADIDPDYVQQANLYGLGHRRAGRRVDHVALVFVPRGGWLSGMYVWSAPYDESIALGALDRRNRVEAGIAYYNVAAQPENWQKFPATPSKGCSWCPWYNPDVATADGHGCPGK